MPPDRGNSPFLQRRRSSRFGSRPARRHRGRNALPPGSARRAGAADRADPRDGRRAAWQDSRFNRAVQARRQPGSSFKPFIYAMALRSGMRPTDTVSTPRSVTRWDISPPRAAGSPRTSTTSTRGRSRFVYALAKSINIPAVKLLERVGPRTAVEFAHSCGIEGPLPAYLSLALGTGEVTPLEMASAYGAFDNQGMRVDPDLRGASGGPDRPNVCAETRPADHRGPRREDERSADQHAARRRGQRHRGSRHDRRWTSMLLRPARPARRTTTRTPGSWVAFPAAPAPSGSDSTRRSRIGSGMTGAKAALADLGRLHEGVRPPPWRGGVRGPRRGHDRADMFDDRSTRQDRMPRRHHGLRDPGPNRTPTATCTAGKNHRRPTRNPRRTKDGERLAAGAPAPDPVDHHRTPPRPRRREAERGICAPHGRVLVFGLGEVEFRDRAALPDPFPRFRPQDDSDARIDRVLDPPTPAAQIDDESRRSRARRSPATKPLCRATTSRTRGARGSRAGSCVTRGSPPLRLDHRGETLERSPRAPGLEHAPAGLRLPQTRHPQHRAGDLERDRLEVGRDRIPREETNRFLHLERVARSASERIVHGGEQRLGADSQIGARCTSRSASGRASLRVGANPPSPTFTSSTSPSRPAAAFFERMLETIRGWASTMPETSLRAYILRSAGTRSSEAPAMQQPTRPTISRKASVSRRDAETRDRLELVERASRVAEGAARDHRDAQAAGCRDGRHDQGNLVAHAPGGVFVNDRRPRGPGRQGGAGPEHGPRQARGLRPVESPEVDGHHPGGQLVVGDVPGDEPADQRLDLSLGMLAARTLAEDRGRRAERRAHETSSVRDAPGSSRERDGTRDATIADEDDLDAWRDRGQHGTTCAARRGRPGCRSVDPDAAEAPTASRDRGAERAPLCADREAEGCALHVAPDMQSSRAVLDHGPHAESRVGRVGPSCNEARLGDRPIEVWAALIVTTSAAVASSPALPPRRMVSFGHGKDDCLEPRLRTSRRDLSRAPRAERVRLGPRAVARDPRPLPHRGSARSRRGPAPGPTRGTHRRDRRLALSLGLLPSTRRGRPPGLDRRGGRRESRGS